jgi:hypothetical protein
MTKTLTVIEAVKGVILREGFDGLCNLDNDGCGCRVDDLAPCGEMNQACELGYEGPLLGDDGNWTWGIYPTKDACIKAVKFRVEREEQ